MENADHVSLSNQNTFWLTGCSGRTNNQCHLVFDRNSLLDVALNIEVVLGKFCNEVVIDHGTVGTFFAKNHDMLHVTQLLADRQSSFSGERRGKYNFRLRQTQRMIEFTCARETQSSMEQSRYLIQWSEIRELKEKIVLKRN